MNREQRREAIKKLCKAGGSKNEAEALEKILKDPSLHNPPQDIAEGSKVRINYEAVVARKTYENTNKAYKEFVEQHHNEVFTAHIERPNCIAFAEDPRFLFWSGDLDVISAPPVEAGVSE